MRTFKLITSGLFLLGVFALHAQSGGTAILPFEKGKILSNDDMNFLNYVVNGVGRSPDSRGALPDINVSGTTLKVGFKLSQKDAQNIEKLIQDFSNSNAALATESPETGPGVSRGANTYCDYCCYYYRWDSRCGCYRYWWYYCCAC